jgi:hypothetical protein
MSEHTPGPWKVSKMTPTRVDTPDGSISVNWTCNYDNGKTDRLAEANARLIAAAPQMAEIVRRLAKWRCGGSGSGNINEIATDAAKLWAEMQKGGGDEL